MKYYEPGNLWYNGTVIQFVLTQQKLTSYDTRGRVLDYWYLPRNRIEIRHWAIIEMCDDETYHI